MGHACLACNGCGHAWRAALPTWPRVARSAVLGAPIAIGGAIGAAAGTVTVPAAIVLVVVGALVAVIAFRLCTPACPECGSDRTLRRGFSLARDARVIAGAPEDPPRRARVG